MSLLACSDVHYADQTTELQVENTTGSGSEFIVEQGTTFSVSVNCINQKGDIVSTGEVTCAVCLLCVETQYSDR